MSKFFLSILRIKSDENRQSFFKIIITNEYDVTFHNIHLNRQKTARFAELSREYRNALQNDPNDMIVIRTIKIESIPYKILARLFLAFDLEMLWA